MAFSQTPQQETHQTKRIPIISGETLASNVLPVTSYQGQRFLNCYPKRIKMDNTDDKWVLTKTPSFVLESKTYASSGTDPITAVSSDSKFLWKGRRLYQVSSSPALIYTDANDITVLSMFSIPNPTSSNAFYAGVLKDNGTGNSHSYTYELGVGFTLSAALSFSLDSSSPDNYKGSVYYNGRLYALGTSGRIYNSNAGAYNTWPSTQFTVPEIDGDQCIALVVYRSHIAAFNQNSIEFYYDAALELGSPLQRQDAYASRLGTRNNFHIAAVGDSVFFWAWEKQHGMAFYVLENFQPLKISNLYVDLIVSNDDINPSFSPILRIFDLMGDVCVGFATSTTNYVMFSQISKCWFEMTTPTVSTGQGLFSIQTAGVSTADKFFTRIISDYTSVSTQVSWYTISKDYNPSTSVTAEYIEDINDLGSQRWKHYEQIYFVGDPGNNTVELAWSQYMDYSNWTSYVSRTPILYDIIRFDNLGRFRRLARRWRFTGTSNIMMEGSEIRYNLGSQ